MKKNKHFAPSNSISNKEIIWFSHFVPYPPLGGLLQRSYNLIKELSNYHTIHLISLIQENLISPMYDSVEAGLRESVDHLSGICKTISLVGMPSDRVAYGRHILAIRSLLSLRSYSECWLDSKELAALLKDFIENNKIDAIHCDTISLAPYLFDNNIMYSKKIPFMALNHHNIESDMMKRRVKVESNLLKKCYFFQEYIKLKRLERKYCSNFSINITCSGLDSERLLSICPKVRTDEIPNGVDLNYFSTMKTPHERKTLIFAGGLSWYPNRDAMHQFAQYVWPRIKQKHPKIIFNLIGKNPSSFLLEVATHDPNFRVLGFVPDVRPYFSASDIYICPIRDGGGTKLKILDALASGLPIVANPIACEGIDVIDGVHVLFAETPDEYAEQITLLLKSSGLRESLGIAGRKLVEEKYSFEAIGLKLANIYQSG